MFNMKKNKVIKHFNTDLQKSLANMPRVKMLIWNHKLMLCDVDFLVANAMIIVIKSRNSNFIFEL